MVSSFCHLCSVHPGGGSDGCRGVNGGGGGGGGSVREVALIPIGVACLCIGGPAFDVDDSVGDARLGGVNGW
jgi:hypothetical protein